MTDDGGEIRDASHLLVLDGEDTLIKLNKEVTEELTNGKPNVGLWKEPGTLHIGPEGEHLVRKAAICTKICHAAGYGDYGGGVGSKNLEAVAAKGKEVTTPARLGRVQRLERSRVLHVHGEGPQPGVHLRLRQGHN